MPKVRFIHSPLYEVDIGAHVFPASKYRLLHDRLMERGLVEPEEFLAPSPATDEEMLRVHTPEFFDDLRNARPTLRTLASELPVTREIIEGFILMCGGTILTAREALKDGVGFHLGGGWHHAFADHAEGFCYTNDIAVAIRALQSEGLARRFFVVDCDVHQGNGTAHIFGGDDDVFTFSIHQEHNYPAKQKSDVDIGLDDGVGDEQYLEALASVVPSRIEAHRSDMVFYVAGADPYRGDQLGGLGLTLEGLRTRDERVIGSVMERRIPLVILLAGGYAFRTDDTVEIHYQTAEVAIERARLLST